MARTDAHAQFNLRLSQALDDLIVTAATTNNRSKTAEIVTRLEQSFTNPQGTDPSTIDASIVQAVLGLDRKLTALCNHLGVKLDS
ncbi:Arc-like DNA binding domain protein [compost metagenome]